VREEGGGVRRRASTQILPTLLCLGLDTLLPLGDETPAPLEPLPRVAAS